MTQPILYIFAQCTMTSNYNIKLNLLYCPDSSNLFIPMHFSSLPSSTHSVLCLRTDFPFTLNSPPAYPAPTVHLHCA